MVDLCIGLVAGFVLGGSVATLLMGMLVSAARQPAEPPREIERVVVPFGRVQ